MPITDKSRKTLWALSGNRCAICRIELVAERNAFKKNLNIGDECHIVSKSTNGPRHIPNYENDYDDYENLILLCKNHHRTIDELWETYSIQLLKLLKSKHETWIRLTLDNAKKGVDKKKATLLPRINSGKQIVNIICEAAAFRFDHCELGTQEEMEFVSSFLQNIQDWGEISGISEFEISRKIQLGFELNAELNELEKYGFLLFGERTKSKIMGPKNEDLGVWDIATLVIERKNNPAILDSDLKAL